MKNIFKTSIISLLFIYTFGTVYSQRPDRGEKQITPQTIKEYVDFLASDSLKGRKTPSKELDIAADYIAAQFQRFGLQKIGGSYFQQIAFCTRNLDVANTQLKIAGKEFQIKTDYVPFEATDEVNTDKPRNSDIVFVGYGITAPEYNYDDYAGVDVKGKIVLVLKHEPGENDTASVFQGTKETEHSFLTNKVKNAKKHGAIGMLLMTDPLNHMMLKPQGYPWPSLSKFASQANDNLPYVMEETDNNTAITVVQVGEGIIDHLFGSIDSLKSIQMTIDKTLKPNSFVIKGSNCELAVKVIVKRTYARNVVGYIRGSDKKLRDEVVVIGGHYDHIGMKGTHRNGEDYIYNGADDNASGTAGVMTVAKAMSVKSKAPRRSILFILFAGEELGLLGSEYYCSHPLLPLDKTVAMLNLDMISRNGKDSLQIEGADVNPDVAAIMLKENEKIGLKYIPTGDEFSGSSDHHSFFVKGISSVDIFAGLHKDYHTVRDNPDKIDHDKAARITRLVYRSVRVMANEKRRYKIINK